MNTPTPRTDAATYPADCLGATLVTNRDCARELERELTALTAERDQLRAELAKERARRDDLVADINDACITLESAIADCDDYALQNTEFKLTAVRDVLLQYIPNAAIKEGAK